MEKTNTYVRVVSKNGGICMGQCLPAWGYTETEPKTLIQRWQKEGGLYLGNRFVPWRLIDSVEWEFNWKPPIN
jgi:hypothetical protein